MARKKMTEEEKIAWESLYYYVKNDILGYDENQSLPSNMVLRLKGLLTNKFMENNNIKSTANYSYQTILNTFKFCSPEIHKALKTKSWTSEQHKFNYILKIVEGNINNVYMRMKNIEKAKEEAKNATVDTANHTGAEYQKKTKEVTNKLLNDLW